MEKRAIKLILVCATTNAGVSRTYVINVVFIRGKSKRPLKPSNTDGPL